MGFFAPWFLAGLAALSLPLYLHLLKKRHSTPKRVENLADVLRIAHAGFHPASPTALFSAAPRCACSSCCR